MGYYLKLGAGSGAGSVSRARGFRGRPRLRRGLTAGATVMLLAAASACSSGGGDAGGEPNGQHLSVEKFDALAARPGTMLVDVRTPAEYAQGHLASAVNIDIEGADFGQRLSSMDKGVTYAVYCRSGHRSATALSQMEDVGFSHVSDLDGGINAWTAAGRPVVTGP